MRLTLRTMLAYLDGILEPEDTQNIGKKIEESTFASDLIHRIRDLLRRPSVNSPDNAASGSSLGPNAVAEYLDNTLTPNRVTEFEKICLDSDIHLAEVAACHQILTLVLGEPAEIDPAGRQRMYDIYSQNIQEATEPPNDEIPLSIETESEVVLPPPLPAYSASSIDVEPSRKKRTKPTIPEYLREPTKKYRWVSIATASVVAICLLIVLLKALGRFEPGTALGNMLIGLGIVQEGKEIGVETNKSMQTLAKSESTAQSKPKSQEKAVAAGSKPSAAEQPSTLAATTGQSEPTPSLEKSGTESAAPIVAPSAEKVLEPIAEIKPDTTPATVEKRPTQEGVSPEEPAKTTEQPSDKEPVESSVSATTAAEEKPLQPSERLGRYMSDDQILLKNSGSPTDWQRVASKEFLSANQQLLVLPTYRPDITLAAGVNLRMLGGTALELLPASPQEPAGIKIRFGRVIVMPLANAGTKLRIIIGQRTGVITFADPEAVVAMDVRRIYYPGNNPETESAKIASELFVTAGHVLWDETGQKTLEIAGPARFALEDQLPPDVTTPKDFPKWITSEPIGMLDRRASATIAQYLLSSPSTRPAQRGLMELAEDRRKEVRWLAIRCLDYLGYFDRMATALDDPEYKSDWDNYIEQLREAVTRDPETAAEVRKSLENRYPQTAADMYRMLWGYTDKNLESGEDEKLVGFLENDNLALRVLGIWNLKDITGKGGQYYQPEQTSAKRQQPIRSWKKSLESAEIRIKSAEEKGGKAVRENSTPPSANE